MEKLNEKNYRDAMNSVHAPAELVERTRNLASGGKKLRNRRKRYRRWVAAIGTAAAVFCLAMTAPHTSVAQYVKDIFHGFWGEKKEVSSYVQTGGIFQDEDEHVKVSVEELLSDGMYVSVVLKYQAKDEKGKKWISKNGPIVGVKTFERSLQLSPKMPVSGSGGGGSELEEYRTDSVRYFVLEFEGSQWSDIKKCVMRYSLTEHVKETELDTSANVPVYEYALKAKGQKKLSKFYEPKVLRLSKLTMSVYGKDTGMSIRYRDEKWHMETFTDEYLAAEKKESLKDVQLIKKDGTYVPLDMDLCWGQGGIEEDAEEKYQCECMVVSASLYVKYVPARDIYSGDRWFEPKYEIQIDPEEIAGLSLTNGKKNVVYQLERLQ